MDNTTLVLSIEDSSGDPLSVVLHPWNTVKDIKDAIQDQRGISSARQRLFFAGTEIKNSRTLVDCGLQTGSPLFLTVNELQSGAVLAENKLLHTYGNCPCTDDLLDRIRQARQGLIAGLAPRLAMEGTGGTYFLRNTFKQTVLVFKPGDEEPFTPNNPRGYTGSFGQSGLRPGILSGEGHLREVAAYLVDHQHFAGVPATTLAEMAHSAFHSQTKHISSHEASTFKVGSLQEFIDSDEVAGDLGPKKFPVREVHKIGLLDIRLVNTDRNDANILVMHRAPSNLSGGLTLVPIDHSYILPDTLEVAWTDWVWYEWPQAKVPFDEETKQYILSLNIEEDIELLRRHLAIREPCLRLMRIAGMLLQKGVKAGLTLYQIASIMTRDDVDKPSELEEICSKATEVAQSVMGKVHLSNSDLQLNGAVRSNLSSETSSNNGISLIKLHRSVSHTNFKQVSSESKAGFGLDTIDQLGKSGRLSRKKRLESSINIRRSERSDDQPNTPEVHRVSKKGLHEPNTSEIFFSYLEKMLDQAIHRVVSKDRSVTSSSVPPSPFFTPLSTTPPSQINIPRQIFSPTNTGFDFVNFTDSSESPIHISAFTSGRSISSLSLGAHKSPTEMDSREWRPTHPVELMNPPLIGAPTRRSPIDALTAATMNPLKSSAQPWRSPTLTKLRGNQGASPVAAIAALSSVGPSMDSSLSSSESKAEPERSTSLMAPALPSAPIPISSVPPAVSSSPPMETSLLPDNNPSLTRRPSILSQMQSQHDAYRSSPSSSPSSSPPPLLPPVPAATTIMAGLASSTAAPQPVVAPPSTTASAAAPAAPVISLVSIESGRPMTASFMAAEPIKPLNHNTPTPPRITTTTAAHLTSSTSHPSLPTNTNTKTTTATTTSFRARLGPGSAVLPEAAESKPSVRVGSAAETRLFPSSRSEMQLGRARKPHGDHRAALAAERNENDLLSRALYTRSRLRADAPPFVPSTKSYDNSPVSSSF